MELGNFFRGSLRKLTLGEHVTIRRPHRISHPESISIGDRTFIHENAMISPIHEYQGVRHNPHIKIGSDVFINANLFLACVSRVEIGDGCVISENVYINDSSHGLDPDIGLIMKQPLIHGGDVIIGDSCFLGLRSAILPGVTLGHLCVVGINAVVTHSFPPHSMLGGAPARLLRTYDSELKAWVRPKPQPGHNAR